VSELTRSQAALDSGAPPRSKLWAHGLLWAYLFSPLVLEIFLRGGAERIDRLYLFNVGTSLLWAGLLVALTRRPALLHLALLPLYVTTAADDFLLFTYQARLSSGYIGIILTDYSEAAEFLSTFARPVAASAAVLALAYGIGVRGLWGSETRRRRWPAALCAGLLATAYVGSTARTVYLGTPAKQAVLEAVGKETSAPLGVVFQAAMATYLHVGAAQLREQRARFRFHASKRWTDAAELYVMVIGESSRPQNWGVLGYARDTTPRLAAISDLVLLRNLLTTSPATSVAVPSMLSLRPITDWPGVQAQKSIVGAFAEAGFKTFWLSAQAADSWGGLIPHLAAEASQRRYFDRGYDDELLEELRNILRTQGKDGRILVVLHTKGSHWRYSRRYPPEFERFRAPGGNARDDLVDAYDNSVLYTDWLLSEVIATARQRGGTAAVVFASDHGENLLDDDRQLLGHVVGNGYDLPAVGLFWLSPALRERHRDRLETLARNARSPTSLSDLAPTLLELAGIETPEWDASRSLLSERFAPKDRYYLLHGKVRAEGKERGG